MTRALRLAPHKSQLGAVGEPRRWHPRRPCVVRHRVGARVRIIALTLLTLLVLEACSQNRPSGPAGDTPDSASASGSIATSVRLVVLGDSIALGETCSGCTTYPAELSAAMDDSLGVDVKVDNLAVPGAEVTNLLQLVLTDSTVRDLIESADAVLVTIGINDLAFNRLDDPCGVAPDYPRIRWSDITHACVDEATAEYRRDLDAVLGEVEELRAGQPTMLRVTTVYNSVIGDLVDPTWNSPAAVEPSMYAVEQMAQAQCEIAELHGGLCADTYHALNGGDGSESAQPYLNPADATHLAQPGEDAFADAIIALGFSPLEG
jgi:lysophospholipase L1-like esterase